MSSALSTSSDGNDGAFMIESINLSKFYGDFAATRDVTFNVSRGEVVAFLGPNGAGKSTTMKLLTGYLAPSTGTARIAGYDTATDRIAAARRLGYLPENGPLYLDMTPRSLLRFAGELQGMSSSKIDDRLESVVELCRLRSVIGKPIGKLSKGFRQRVGMARVLLHEPDVLILDEPTAGLDPNQIREVRNTIRKLGKRKQSCSRRTSCRRSRLCATVLSSSMKDASCLTVRLPNSRPKSKTSTSASTN